MEPHDSRDLDSVIDDVARALTSRGLARDLRPAVASRLSRGLSWRFGWRAGVAAAIASVVLAAVALLPRPATEPPRTRVAERPAAASPPPPLVVTREEGATPPLVRRAGVTVHRQIVDEDAATESIVEIEPVAILPLRAEGAPAPTQARIEIAPIDVEPVRIRELGEAGE